MRAGRARSGGSDADPSVDRAPLAFFVLVFVLSAPFVAIGQLTGALLLPGLPIAALQAVSPAVAAVVLVAVRHGAGALGAFLRHAFAVWPRARQVPALLLAPPAVLAVAWLVQRAAGVPVPAPEPDIATIAVLFAVFLIAAVAEELGWSSYALPPLRARWGPLAAAVGIGLVWALMHVAALLQAGRDGWWIAWWAIATVALRVILVATFAWTGGGVMGVAILHASYNVSWQSYPESGSYWDPAVVAPILVVVAVAAMLGGRGFRRAARTTAR